VKLLLENYEGNSIVIRGGDVHIATLQAADHTSCIFCDICMFSIPDIDVHHHCGVSDPNFATSARIPRSSEGPGGAPTGKP
jgi:hypothetical protein